MMCVRISSCVFVCLSKCVMEVVVFLMAFCINCAFNVCNKMLCVIKVNFVSPKNLASNIKSTTAAVPAVIILYECVFDF